jgi:hypothetical protein
MCGRALALFCAGEADVRAEWAGWLAGLPLVGWFCVYLIVVVLFCLWVDEIVFLLHPCLFFLCA